MNRFIHIFKPSFISKKFKYKFFANTRDANLTSRITIISSTNKGETHMIFDKVDFKNFDKEVWDAIQAE